MKTHTIISIYNFTPKILYRLDYKDTIHNYTLR